MQTEWTETWTLPTEYDNLSVDECLSSLGISPTNSNWWKKDDLYREELQYDD